MSALVQEASTRAAVSDFILNNFLFGNESAAPRPDQSLLDSRIIDSTGVLELIEFLEETFSIEIGVEETTPANLDSIDQIAAFVARKKS